MRGSKPGERRGGRKKGTPNKTTSLAKDAIAKAADRLGGVNRLVEWAKSEPQNERVFWGQIYTKLLPLQLDHSGAIDLTTSKEQRDAAVAAASRANG